MSEDDSGAVSALEENLWSQWSLFGAPEECEFSRSPAVYRLSTPIASLPYNGVFRFCVRDEEADGLIDDLIREYKQRGVQHFWLQHPTAAPADLGERLARRGFVEAEVFAGMIARPHEIEPDGEAPEGVVIHEIGAADEDAVVEMVATRWSVPADAARYLVGFYRSARVGEADAAIRGWIASIDGHPVGKAFTHRHNGVVGLYGVSTIAEARGRGVARAMCLRALHASVMAESDRLALHSTPMAANLYRKMGFRDVAPFRLFADNDFHL